MNAALWVWNRLTAPTKRKPQDYSNRGLAKAINAALDGNAPGPASQALLGESVALATDEVLHGASNANTPLGHLVHATGSYVVLSWKDDSRTRRLRNTQGRVTT